VAPKVILMNSPMLAFGAILGDLPDAHPKPFQILFKCEPRGLSILLFNTFKMYKHGGIS
jgi:hypothetical protein